MTTSRRLRQAPLSCAAAWIPSPGPWRRSGHDPGTSGVPGAARWVCGGLGTGPDRTEAGLGWARGSGQAALGGEGWGLGSGEAPRAPGGCVLSSGAAGVLAPPRGPLARVAAPTGARAGWVAANEGSFRAALGRLCRGARRNAGKNRGLGVQQLCSRSPRPPPSRQVLGWPKGDSGVRAALRKVVADEHC